MSRSARYKWEDDGFFREYLETTTEAMQYHYHEHPRWLDSADRSVGGPPTPWASEIKINSVWRFVGEFRTGREAKAAAISAYETDPGTHRS